MYKKSTSFFVLTLLFITLFKANPEKVQASGLFAPLSWQESFNSSTTQQFRIIKEYNGSLYAAGHNNAGIDGRLYRFDGVSWQDLNFNTQVAVNVETIEYLYVFNNRLYIGARVNVSGNCYARVYYYDGITFSLDISRNGTCGYSGIESFTIHNGNLYASNGSPLGEVYQRISDGNWITVGSTIEAGSPVRALASYNGSLYAGTGAFGDNARVWRWTGSNWVLEVDFKTGFGTTKDGVINLATVNGLLFAGTDGPGSTSYVFSFDGTNWVKSFELSGCGSTRLSVIDNILWAGFALPGSATCYGQVYRLENGTWIDSGNLGDAAQSDFTFFDEYMGNIYGATLNNGKIFYTTLDTISPTVASHTLQTSYTDTGPSTFTVTFSEDVSNPAGDAGTDDVTNPSNYKIINKGANGTVETATCASPLSGDDTLFLPSSITYINPTAIVNLSSALPAGNYHLFVCGTTSVVDLAANPLNNGTDFTFDFTVGTATGTGTTTTITNTSASSLPKTGFAPNKVTTLLAQPANLEYAKLGDIVLEIPSLKVKSTIVGVPQNADKTWDVTWLGNDTGWLNGTAFPTWNGNSVLTAHVTNASGLEGPFAALKSLKYGDQIIVHLGGVKYVYEVRATKLTRPYSTNYAFESKSDAAYLTLITCQGYNPLNESYLFRRVVRAVLVSTISE